MYIHTHMCIYIHTCMHTSIHIYTYIYICDGRDRVGKGGHAQLVWSAGGLRVAMEGPLGDHGLTRLRASFGNRMTYVCVYIYTYTVRIYIHVYTLSKRYQCT